MKAVLYEKPYKNPVQQIAYAGFRAIGEREVSGRITVPQDQLEALFAMTPYYWKTPRGGAERLAALPELEPEPETPDPDFAEAEARRLLELLPPAEQELFRKRYLEGYTAAELGKMYGLPPATVRTRLAKARRYLSQLLMEE